MTNNKNDAASIAGLAIIGTCIIGVASLIAALFSFLAGDFAAGGICLLASALSFGLLANAVLRE